MRYQTDPGPAVLLLQLDASESAQTALEQSLVLLAKRPELWSWDWIVEAPEVPEDASVDQISRLADTYVRPESDATTVLVSGDRFLHLWARVMDFQFPRRDHVVVRNIEDARTLLRARRERQGPAELERQSAS